MTIARLVRTTTFKLSAIYLAVFSLFAVSLIVFIAHNTTRLLTRQLTETVNTEIRDLAREFEFGGIRRLAREVDRRSRQPGANLYLVSDFTGNMLAGNVAALTESLLSGSDMTARTVRYARFDDPDDLEHTALIRVTELPGGFRMLVGRDVGEREKFRAVIRDAFRLSIAVMVVLGLLSWFFVSRRVLKRIDGIVDSSRGIMAGDLSGRLPVAGTGDEFDRLAGSLNAMLSRIEQLMKGLKEVSDDIAHDLKTPLTRLRNRVEATLREPASEEHYREALERTIEESDGLIRTFDALLHIARVEAGSADVAMAPVDAAAIAREMAELYEPVAEEEGIAFRFEAIETAPIEGSRELIAQALANLLDNAIKYARLGGADDRAAMVVLAVGQAGSGITLAVLDNGPGIPEMDRGRVRERFVRLEASRSEPGSGLGLSLVEAVARLHGGTLELADNRPGLKAILTIPVRGGGWR